MNISSVSFSNAGISSMPSMQGVRGSQGMRESAADFASKIMEQDDADGDGALSIEETPLSEELFAAIDADGDGLLTVEELETHHESMKDSMPMMPPIMNADAAELASQIIEQDDADGDGVLSIEETPLSEELFAAIDADGDGALTAEELQTHQESMQTNGMAGPPPPPPPPGGDMSLSAADRAAEIVEQDDADGDGVLSIEETPLSEELFAEIDSDGDGLLTVEELESHHESMQETMAQGLHAGTPPAGGAIEESQESSFTQLQQILNQAGGTQAYQQQGMLAAMLQGTGSTSEAMLAMSA